MVKIKAFTLLELMLAAIIVSTMTGVAIMSFNKVMRTTSEQRAVLNLKAIHAANEIYTTRNGKYWHTDLADVDAINASLETDIVAGDTGYSYTVTSCTGDGDCISPGVCSGAVCTGEYSAEADVANYNFKLMIDQDVISTTNPCCSFGTCPTAGNCQGGGPILP